MHLPQASRSRLQYQHLAIEGFINELTSPEISLHIYEGKWSIHQQLAHLYSYQKIFMGRLNTIMSSFNATFKPYRAEEDPEFILAEKLSDTQLLAGLKKDRNTLNHFLFNLDSGELSRKGSHPAYGNLSIAMWTEFFLLHEAHHLYAIFRMAHDIRKK